MTATLYEIIDEFQALDALLEESGGEVTPEIEAWQAEYGALLEQKTDAIAGYLRSLEATEKAHKAEKDRHGEREQVAKNKQKRLKAMVQLQMERSGRDEFKGRLFSLKLQKNGGAAPITYLVADPEKYPADCRVVTPTIDKDAVRAKLEAGDPELDGLAAFAPAGYHVRVR